MQYIITFLEGIISFISPCMLPMLPIYISYFAGSAGKSKSPLPGAISFVCGFTLVFCLMGIFAGSVGALLMRYQTAVNIISGIIVVLLGLSYLEIIRIPFFRGAAGAVNITNSFSAFLFGIVFSVSLTPCVGAFLGSALMMASGSGTALKGVTLLLTYSLGMGIPFLLSAVLIEKLGTVFTVIKKNYRIINLVSGIFLIIVGISMMTGFFGSILNLFSGGV